MSYGRRVHKTTDTLPASAWQVMVDGFRGTKTHRQISEELLAMGFRVPERTVARRSADWRAEKLRRETMQAVGTEALHVDLLDEVVRLIGVLDVRPGWVKRARRRVQKAVMLFFDEETPERARAVKLELARFCLERFYSSVSAISDTGVEGSGQQEQPVDQG